MQVMHVKRKRIGATTTEAARGSGEDHALGLVMRGEQLAEGLSGTTSMQVGGIGTLLAEKRALELCYTRQATSKEGTAECDGYYA